MIVNLQLNRALPARRTASVFVLLSLHSMSAFAQQFHGASPVIEMAPLITFHAPIVAFVNALLFLMMSCFFVLNKLEMPSEFQRLGWAVVLVPMFLPEVLDFSGMTESGSSMSVNPWIRSCAIATLFLAGILNIPTDEAELVPTEHPSIPQGIGLESVPTAHEFDPEEGGHSPARNNRTVSL